MHCVGKQFGFPGAGLVGLGIETRIPPLFSAIGLLGWMFTIWGGVKWGVAGGSDMGGGGVGSGGVRGEGEAGI